MAVLAPAALASTSTATPCASDWTTYGGSAHHTFTNATCLDQTNVHTLAPTWFFKTGDAVTANPVVVGNRVYVGSWDGNFYAIDKASGQQVWKFAIKPQPAVIPQEGPNGRVLDPTNPESFATSDGGLITSSAWYEPASVKTHGRNLVIFGGGYTLYALDADTGQKVVVLDAADCNFSNTPAEGIYNEKVFALHPNDGSLAWVFDPQRVDNGCDWDFGATANTDGGSFLGVGGKDGTYYSIDPVTGA